MEREREREREREIVKRIVNVTHDYTGMSVKVYSVFEQTSVTPIFTFNCVVIQNIQLHGIPVSKSDMIKAWSW